MEYRIRPRGVCAKEMSAEAIVFPFNSVTIRTASFVPTPAAFVNAFASAA